MPQAENTFLSRRTLQIALAAVIVLTGLLIRLYDLTDLLMDFHPARQYHSAILARGLYQSWGGVYPADQTPLIQAQFASEARIEPPIMETLTAGLFLLFRTDALWIARLLSIAFWMAGGYPLFRMLRRSLGFTPALLGLGFYLLVPFGVIASRSFQPDPLMVALAFFALDAIDRYAQQPAWKAAITAGLWMGAAILVKQVMVFLLPAALILAVWRDNGFRRLLRDTRMWAMGILALLPAVLYNLYGIFISGTLAGQYAQRFFPNLWIDPGFYIRWSRMIADTLSLPVFLLALAGILLLPRSGMKTMWIGYGIGYLLYGFVFAHHISTHDYYQLPLFPLAAAGVGSALSSLWSAVRQINPGRLGMAAAASLFVAAALLSVWETRSDLNRVDYRADAALLADLADRMGGPHTKVVGLTEDYGAALNYYGFLLPVFWEPRQNGAALAAMSEHEVEQAVLERVQGKSYLFISDLHALNSQPLVRRFLDTHYELFYQDTRYLIYDLKNPPQQTGWLEDTFKPSFLPAVTHFSGARS